MINEGSRGIDNGLERSCDRQRPDWIASTQAADGVELLRAWFAGRGFATHRHDTYAIGMTDAGVQAFDYRGAAKASMPGQVVVLHPDEPHDGRAGTPDGFGYRIVYVAPSRIADAARAIRGRPTALPFAREPVLRNAPLARAIDAAFDDGAAPLAIDQLVVDLTDGLLAIDRSGGEAVGSIRIDDGAVARARQFLDAETTRVIRSDALEAVTGLTRYELARHFRAAVGTSPYRYSLLRRLDATRARLSTPAALVDVALGAGFADQAHFSRLFKAAFGITPARYRALDRRAKAEYPRLRFGERIPQSAWRSPSAPLRAEPPPKRR